MSRSDQPIIRMARAEDAAAIQRIYAPFVRDTAITFETVAPTEAEILDRLTATLPTLPWLVAETDGNVLAYAYASRHHTRAAYRWSVDVSVYVDPVRHRRGIGRALYLPLLDRLRRQGFYTAYAAITLPNEASVGLHETLGFQPLCVFRHVGYKLGDWRDVGYWQLELRPADGVPPEPGAVDDEAPDRT